MKYFKYLFCFESEKKIEINLIRFKIEHLLIVSLNK